jgi:hypothetical protein
MNFTKVSGALAGLSLVCGTAFAQSEPVQAPELPSIIILEMQPGEPGQAGQEGSDAAAIPDQALIEMLLMQLFANPQVEGPDQSEQMLLLPNTEPGVGI